MASSKIIEFWCEHVRILLVAADVQVIEVDRSAIDIWMRGSTSSLTYVFETEDVAHSVASELRRQFDDVTRASENSTDAHGGEG